MWGSKAILHQKLEGILSSAAKKNQSKNHMWNVENHMFYMKLHRVLLFPPTVQKYTSELNWRIKIKTVDHCVSNLMYWVTVFCHKHSWQCKTCGVWKKNPEQKYWGKHKWKPYFFFTLNLTQAISNKWLVNVTGMAHAQGRILRSRFSKFSTNMSLWPEPWQPAYCLIFNM